MIPVIVLRPQPGCDATVAAARASDLDAYGFPLFVVAPRAWQPPSADSIDALLLGSANAVRHGGAALTGYAGLPIYVVGNQTASVARAAGLNVVLTGEGGLQQVLTRLHPGDRRLLRLAGAARVALDRPPGVTIVERVVYASEPVPLPPALVARLAGPALVLLHSAEAARHFAAECDRLHIARAQIMLAALGPRIAEAAGNGWRVCASAQSPDNGALLALARRMCQEPRP